MLFLAQPLYACFSFTHAFKASKALSCIVVSSLFSAVGKWRCKTWVGYLEGVSLVTLVAVFQWSTYTLSLNSCIKIRSVAPMVSL